MALLMSSFGSLLNRCRVTTRPKLLHLFLKPLSSEHSDRCKMLRLCRALKPSSSLLFCNNNGNSHILNIQQMLQVYFTLNIQVTLSIIQQQKAVRESKPRVKAFLTTGFSIKFPQYKIFPVKYAN